MPEIRRDPVLGHRIIVAPERLDRPFEHASASSGGSTGERELRCPFCRGHEDATPESVLVVTDRDEIITTSDHLTGGESTGRHLENWSVRVIPNRYPALRESLLASNDRRQGPVPTSADIEFLTEPGAGIHEVIIESPDHVGEMHALPIAQFQRVIRAWHARTRRLMDSDVAAINIFRNSGAGAGASLSHVHSQLIATPFVPALLDEELAAGANFLAIHGRTIWQAVVDAEVTAQTRIVSRTPGFTTFCPFASRFPGEQWIVPCDGTPGFEGATAAQLDGLASMLRDALIRQNTLFPSAPFNLVLRSAPLRDARRASMTWHLRIIPRITGVAGYETGSASWINVLAPEEAARRLRSC